jgi:hypothetical protein
MYNGHELAFQFQTNYTSWQTSLFIKAKPKLSHEVCKPEPKLLPTTLHELHSTVGLGPLGNRLNLSLLHGIAATKMQMDCHSLVLVSQNKRSDIHIFI